MGVMMQPGSMIKYDFRGSGKPSLAEKVRVGFTTTESLGFLVGAFSDLSQEYLMLSIAESGGLKFEFDFGFGRQELLDDDQDLKSGQFHDVTVERFDQVSIL
jgi:hypothetical protein